MMLSGDEFYDDEVTSPTEDVLRSHDVRKAERPDEETLDRLAANGHARHGFCEKCWGDAYLRMLSQPSRSQPDHYADILRENETRWTIRLCQCECPDCDGDGPHPVHDVEVPS